MTVFHVVTTLLIIAALLAYINQRFLRLQPTIGIMLLALMLAAILEVLHLFQLDILHTFINDLLKEVNFCEFVLQVILCFLLFAGSLNMPLKTLAKKKWSVITLALIGTFVTTFIIGTLTWLALDMLGLHVSYVYALIFGAIITPTDPIAALSILHSMGIPEELEVVIDGESQFNDGVGVVIFVTLTGIAFGGADLSVSGTTLLFLQEVVGGIGLGLMVAAITHYLLKGVNDTDVQLLLTLAMASLNYAIADSIHVSGPLASVVLGIVVGNYSFNSVLDKKSREHIKVFWEMVNTTLVSILFVLVGLEVLMVKLPKFPEMLMPLIAIPMVLIARYISTIISGYIVNLQGRFNFSGRHKIVNLLTWAGLKGGLGIALVMSLPAGELRDLYLLMTYAVVVFSILIQGSTIKLLFSKEDLKAMVNPNK